MADIQHALQIAASPETIYPLVATGKGFSQWWAADVIESNNAVELGFFNRTTTYRLRLAASQEPIHGDWICETGKEWSGTHIVFRMQPAGSGSLLRFTHEGWESATDYFVSCNTVWGELMFRLKAASEGKSPGPLFLPDGLAY
ncbi:MAG TPA: hypothetical protein VIY49_13955 [Bryobacteraceae bacterium]